jgi:hypothetical protein
VAIQFKDGKILFVDGKIAMDPRCCCGGCGCCDCPTGQIRYDATFSGDMAELNGTYTSANRESFGEEGCRYTFDSGPIASITFDCAGPAVVVYINAATVNGDLHTYHNYSDGDWAVSGGCPITFGELYQPEWADGPGYPPAFIWHLLSLVIRCAEAFEVAAPGWTQESEEIP